jgi:hypothetical protein
MGQQDLEVFIKVRMNLVHKQKIDSGAIFYSGHLNPPSAVWGWF